MVNPGVGLVLATVVRFLGVGQNVRFLSGLTLLVGCLEFGVRFWVLIQNSLFYPIWFFVVRF